MADGKIDIGAEQAIKEINLLKLGIDEATKSLIELNKGLIQSSSSLRTNITDTKSLTDVEKRLSEQEQIMSTQAQKIVDLNNKLKKSVQDYTDSELKKAQVNRDNLAIQKQTIIANDQESGTMEKLIATNKLLAIEQKKLNLETVAGQNRHKEIVKSLNANDEALMVLGSTMQRQKSNVGNYTNANWGLSNSINQITREAPAAAISMSTFFLAISNNIPMLTDQIGLLKEQNKALKENGEKTKSVLGSVVGAFFSWQTALSLGVALLTLYGAKMITWIGTLIQGNELLKTQQDLIDDTNKSVAESNKLLDYQLSILNKVGVTKRFQIEQDIKGNEIIKDKLRYALWYAESLDAGSKKEEEVLKAKANLLQQERKLALLKLDLQKQIADDDDKKLDEELKRIDSKFDAYDKRDKKAAINAKKAAAEKKKADDIIIAQILLEVELNEKQAKQIEEYLLKAKKDINEQEKDTIKLQKEKIDQDIYILKNDKDSNINKKEYLDLIYKEIDAEIALIELSNISSFEKLKQTNELKNLRGELKKDNDSFEISMQKSVKYSDDMAKTMQATFDLYNAISDRKMAIIDAEEKAELNRAKKVYDTNIRNGMNEVDAKAKYEADKNAAEVKYLNAREQQRYKQAKKEKNQAIIMANINTAVAVGKVAPNYYEMALVGVLGGIQLGIIAAQKIPEPEQYWKGTDYHKGGKAFVGEKGVELGILPDGKQFLTPAQTTLMDLPRGTKIKTHDETMRLAKTGQMQNVDMSGVIQAIENKKELSVNVNEKVYIALKQGALRTEYINQKYRS